MFGMVWCTTVLFVRYVIICYAGKFVFQSSYTRSTYCQGNTFYNNFVFLRSIPGEHKLKEPLSYMCAVLFVDQFHKFCCIRPTAAMMCICHYLWNIKKIFMYSSIESNTFLIKSNTLSDWVSQVPWILSLVLM